VRRDDNSWSNPAFVALSGGSIGWQVGAQSTDIILVFKTRKGVDGISNGKLTLGADASIAAGPVGRQASAATDLQFQAEVVSYSRNRGLFAGVSFEGSGVTMDRKANAAFYGNPSITPEQIFAAAPQTAPEGARGFVQLLTAQTSQLPTQPSLQDGNTTTAQGRPSNSSASPRDDEPAVEGDVKTFGMPDPDATEPPDDGF
jgi:lipid-binding SYLF domain-containing protein